MVHYKYFWFKSAALLFGQVWDTCPYLSRCFWPNGAYFPFSNLDKCAKLGGQVSYNQKIV